MSRNKPTKRATLANEGFIGRLSYFLTRALINVRQNMFVTIVTTGTITLALLIISFFLLIFVNLEGVADNWSKRVQVTAYFDQELPAPELDMLKRNIQALPGTAQITYVGKQEAVQRFRARLKGQEALLDGITPDILPASLEIGLSRGSRDSQSVEAYVARLKQLPGIQEVQYGVEWVRRFNTFLNFMRMIGALLGGFLLLAVIFIVSNTIKLTIYARKEELELLGLVGATKLFIGAPFIIEGVIQGAIGSLLAILLLTGSYFAFLHNAGNFLSFNPSDSGLMFLSGGYLLGILIGGIGLGFLARRWSV